MLVIDRITFNPNTSNSKHFIICVRINVSIVLNLLANGMNKAEVLDEYRYLEPEDIEQCLDYAAYLAEGRLSESEFQN